MKKLITLITIISLLTVPVWAVSEAESRHAQEVAHQMAECARELGYAEDHIIIREASSRWWAEQRIIEALHEQDTEVAQIPAPEPGITFTEAQMEEYPVACGVWRYLREDMGLSAPVAAGIMGNMMAECGGQTLALQPYLCVNNFVGLCMWYSPYTNGRLTYGADVTDQLRYLSDTLETNMEYFGGDYEYFCGLENAGDTAWYFDEYYERGGWHSVRARNAEAALEYFGEG